MKRPAIQPQHKVQWQYGQGTTLTLVRYHADGGLFLQSVGEDDNGVIELPPHLLRSIAEALLAITPQEVAS